MPPCFVPCRAVPPWGGGGGQRGLVPRNAYCTYSPHCFSIYPKPRTGHIDLGLRGSKTNAKHSSHNPPLIVVSTPHNCPIRRLEPHTTGCVKQPWPGPRLAWLGPKVGPTRQCFTACYVTEVTLDPNPPTPVHVTRKWAATDQNYPASHVHRGPTTLV